MPEDRTVERELLAKYRDELKTAKDELAVAEDKVRRYELAVQGLEAVLGPADPDRRDGDVHIGKAIHRLRDRQGPRGEAAVRAVLEENPRDGFTARELYEELKERGWISEDSTNPMAATRAAANRLRAKDDRIVFEDGHFHFRPETRDPMQSQIAHAELDLDNVESP